MGLGGLGAVLGGSGALGTIGLGTGIALGDMFMQERTNRAQQDMFNHGLSWQREYAMNKYKYTTADMRAAGLNPLLAVTKGIGTGSTGAPGVPGLKAPRFDPQRMVAFAQMEQMRAATAREVATAKQIGETTKGQEIANTAAKMRLEKERMGSDFYKDVNELRDQAETAGKKAMHFLGTTARDVKNRWNYIYQDWEERKKGSPKQKKDNKKVYIGINKDKPLRIFRK